MPGDMDMKVECHDNNLSASATATKKCRYQVWEASLVEEGRRGGRLRRRRVRCRHKIGKEQCYCHNIVAVSNFVLSGFSYATRHLDSTYYD